MNVTIILSREWRLFFFPHPQQSASEGRVPSVSVTRTYAFSLTILSSDIRLKENIKLIGHSDSKIPIYEFNFKKDPKKIKWTGAMAQDLLEMGRDDAVYISEHGEEKGYYGVHYDKIDVDLLSENLISEEII